MGKGIRTVIASALLLSVAALACFPGYCDLCSYRDLRKPPAGNAPPVLADSSRPCCGAVPDPPSGAEEGGLPDDAGSGKGKPVGVRPSRLGYCITSTLSTLVVPVVLSPEGAGTAPTDTSRTPRASRPRAFRLALHAGSRAPPAA